jgi:hypothetical protein
MNSLAGTRNTHANRLVRWHGSGCLAMLLALGLPAMVSAQAVVPASRPLQPGAVPFVPLAGKKPSQSGPQPIPESLLRSAIVPPPAQTYVPTAQTTVPIPAMAMPLVPPPVITPLAPEALHDTGSNSGSLEEKHLLPLLLREQDLLKHYGSDHPEVEAIRARIAVVREWLARQPSPPQPAPVVRVEARTAAGEEPVAPARSNQTPLVQETRPQLPPPAAPSPTVERVIEVRQLPAEQPAGSPTNILVQLVSILAALVVMLLVQLVALFVVLRRYAGKLTPQVRVEVVNSGGDPSPPLPPEVMSQRIAIESPEPAPRNTSPPPMPDLPSYEEVRRAEEEAAQQQDDAVFRQVFEDNLRLREQLAAAGSGSD